MTRSLFAAVCIVVAFVGCGKPPEVCDPDALSQKPQVCPQRKSLGFGTEYYSATYIGSKPVDSFIIRNGGVEDLIIDSMGTSGDTAFKYKGSWEADGGTMPLTVKGNKSVVVQVEFAPTQARGYQGSVTISSNAQNDATLILSVTGCGLPADGGTSPCYRDGGVAP